MSDLEVAFNRQRPSATELSKLPIDERAAILEAQATMADELYRRDRELTSLDTFDEADHLGKTMIANDRELVVMTERIGRLQAQLARLRQVEANPANYRAAAGGFLAEVDRMQLEVREYLSLHPAEVASTA